VSTRTGRQPKEYYPQIKKIKKKIFFPHEDTEKAEKRCEKIGQYMLAIVAIAPKERQRIAPGVNPWEEKRFSHKKLL